MKIRESYHNLYYHFFYISGSAERIAMLARDGLSVCIHAEAGDNMCVILTDSWFIWEGLFFLADYISNLAARQGCA